MEMMSKILGGRKVAQEEVTKANGSIREVSLAKHVVGDKSPIESRLPANKEKFRKIIARFTNRLGDQLKKIEKAKSRGDLKQVAQLAHWLKGAGGSVGFDVFTEPAARLEAYAKEGNIARVETAIAFICSLAQRISTPKEHKPVVSRLANNPRLQPAILKFVEKLNNKITLMEDALKKDDLAELAELAHWLKGAGGTVGYDDFTKPAADLEISAKSKETERASRMFKEVKSLATAIEPPFISDRAGRNPTSKHIGAQAG
jgi:HPt (histidine-containing phosphotransfer) domain-containing protein